MRKNNAVTICLFLWTLAFSSFSVFANDVKHPKLKIDNQEIKKVHAKILYFDSLEMADSMTHYVKLGYDICNKLDLNKIKTKDTRLAIADIYHFYGNINYYSNDVFESINGYEKAIKIYRDYDITAKYADCIFDLATNYSKVGQEPKSLELMHEATSIFIDLKDTASITAGYRSIGVLYDRQKDYSRAHEYFNKALKLSKSTDDVEASIHLLLTLAVTHKRSEELDKALALYMEALDLAKRTEDKLTKSTVYSNLGEFYKNTGDLDNAKIYFDKANEIIENSDSDYKRSYMWVNYSDYYFLKGDYQQAVFYGEKALQLCEEIKNRRGEYVMLNVLLKIYEKLDDSDKLAIYQKRVIEHLNEHKDQLNEQINELETVRFKLDKQSIIAENEKVKSSLELERKNKERNYFYIILIGLFATLLTFSLIIYFRLRTIKAHNKYITKQSEERKLLLQEVHHRVKNNFQIVSSMLRLQSYNFDNEELHKNFHEAVNRINAMGIIHDVIYRQEKFKDIDAKSYLEKLVINLNKAVHTRIEISIDSEEIPFKIETLINLGIALNELITNSFKHAFNKEIVNPKINISLRRIKDKSFEMIYRDNGVGINAETYTASFGMELIETIISNYDGKVEVSSQEDWKTVFRITFEEF